MAPSHPDIVPVIEEWLQSINEEITSFWVGAEWRMWARFELFMEFEKELGSSCLVTHSIDFWENTDEQIDVLIEPRENEMHSIAIKLRCERVSENAGSYEKFHEEFISDMRRIKELGRPDPDFEGTRVLLVGFSGEPSSPDDDDGETGLKTKSDPQHFSAGEVHAWIMEYDPPAEILREGHPDLAVR